MYLLVAEDDRRMAKLLEQGLRSEGHVVDTASDGDEALQLALDGDYDVLVLDVMMPHRDGISVVSELRERAIGTPALLLTARGELADRVRGLDSGADDYLVKPFEFDELVARVRALGRRHGEPEGTELRVGQLALDLVRHEVRSNGTPIDLAPTEFRLLELLMRHPDQVLSRRTILARVWGHDEEPQANLVDVYVHYVRRKLGAEPRISAIRGIGYRLNSPK